MNYRIEKKESFRILGQKSVCGTGAWGKFMEHFNDKLMNYYKAPFWQAAAYPFMYQDYIIGAEYNGEPIIDGLEIQEIPAGTWAAFDVEWDAANDATGNTFKKVVSEWLLSSEYKRNENLPHLEVYGINMQAKCEIWIPILDKHNMEANKCFESERLFYRLSKLEDAETMQKYMNEESRRKWFYWQEPDCLTLEWCVKEIKKNIALWSRKLNILEDHFDFAIVLKKTGEYIGSVGISGEGRKNAEMGYSICEAHQGNGYATEAAKAVINWGFEKLEELGAPLKIGAEIEHENCASRKVAEKAGLKLVRTEQYLSVYEIEKDINTRIL